MDSEPSRTYDTKDAVVGGNGDDDVAATTTTTTTNAAAAAVVADVNESDEQTVNTNNQSEFEQIDNNNNNNNNKKVDEQDKEADEAYSVDILLNAQLCNSCSKEKATVICTLCISDNTSAPYFNGKNPVVINSLDHEIKCGQHLTDEVKDEGDFINDCQKKSLLDNDKEIANVAPVGDECNVQSQTVIIEQLIKSKKLFHKIIFKITRDATLSLLDHQRTKNFFVRLCYDKNTRNDR
jgi:hypothetical protein